MIYHFFSTHQNCAWQTSGWLRDRVDKESENQPEEKQELILQHEAIYHASFIEIIIHVSRINLSNTFWAQYNNHEKQTACCTYFNAYLHFFFCSFEWESHM